MKYIVSKTYDVVTPESAAEGDVADSGFEFEAKEMDLEDVMREVEELGSYENLQDAPVSQSLYAADGHTDYKTGEETRYALHIDGSEKDMQLLVDILEGRKKMPKEGSLEHQADELLKMFSKNISIDEVVAQEEPKEVEIGGLTFTYGGRELSASLDDLLFIWDVNSIGDRHSYMLFDIQDENGESVTESVTESGEKFKKLTRQLAAKGARDPKALAAWIGREKLGKEAFQKKAAAGRKAKVGEVKENLVHAEYDNDYLKELDKLSNDELMAQYKSAMQMYKDQVSKGNEKSFIAQDAKRDLKHIRKVARDGGLKLESTELAVTESFGRHEKYNYAVKVDGVDSKFYMMPFGRQLDDLKKIKKFTETAKTAYVGAKGKATLAAVKDWVRDMKPTQYYAKWQADSSDWKNDSVEIFYVGARELKPIDSTDLAVTVEGKTYGYALTESRIEESLSEKQQDELCKEAKAKFGKNFWCQPGYLWGDGAVFWTGEGAFMPDEMPAYYEQSGGNSYDDFGVHKDLAAWASSKGIMLEPYDPGTLLGYHHGPSKQLKEAWLPRMLKPEHENLVAEVSNKIGYDVEVAQAFAVALLEDVNAHEEAAKVNAALTEIEESKQLKEAYEVLIKDKEAAIECLEYILSTEKKDYFEQCRAEGWDCEDINNPHIYAVACKAFGDPVMGSKQLKEEAEETEKELTKKLQEKQKKIRDLIPSVVSAVNDIRTPDPDSVKYEIKPSDFKKDLKIALMKLDSVEKKLEEIKAQSLKESVEKEQAEEDEMNQLDKMQAELQALYKSDKPEDAEKAKELQPKVDALFKKLYSVESKLEMVPQFEQAKLEAAIKDHNSKVDHKNQAYKMLVQYVALKKHKDAAAQVSMEDFKGVEVPLSIKSKLESKGANLNEALGDGPAVYVGTYGKYAGGSIAGKWLNLEDYADLDEFMEAAKDLHKDEEDPELMFQDYQGFPERYYSESSISPKVWEWLELDEEDRELLEVYIDQVNDEDATIDQARERYMGKFDSEDDWAMEEIEQNGVSPEQAVRMIYVDNVTARSIGIEDADLKVDNMSDEEVVEEAGLTEEYDAAMEAEDVKAAEKIVMKARDEVSSSLSDEIEKKVIDDPIGYFVEELGYSEEDLPEQSFISLDYSVYVRDAKASGSVSFVHKDGDVWVFANY